MKPNDKAIDAGFEASAISVNGSVFGRVSRSTMKEILEAAYAAQFQSGDYAGLIRELRMRPHRRGYETEDEAKERRQKEREASADAIEAVLVERDALKAELASGNMWIQARATVLEELAMVRAERDALAARLAPVEDATLVEIVAVYCSPEMNWNEMSEKWKNSCRRDARAAIAAIRPHIEAAEREMCAKIADKYEGEWHSDTADACARAIAAAIRSGK